MDSESPVNPAIEKSAEISITLKDDVLDCWQKIGKAAGLGSDSLIADFLVQLYRSNQDGHTSLLTCVFCHTILPRVCVGCQQSPLQSQENSTLETSGAKQQPVPLCTQSEDLSISREGIHGRKIRLTNGRSEVSSTHGSCQLNSSSALVKLLDVSVGLTSRTCLSSSENGGKLDCGAETVQLRDVLSQAGLSGLQNAYNLPGVRGIRWNAEEVNSSTPIVPSTQLNGGHYGSGRVQLLCYGRERVLNDHHTNSKPEKLAKEGLDKTAVKADSNESYPCPRCLMMFSDEQGFKVHMQKAHGESVSSFSSGVGFKHLCDSSNSSTKKQNLKFRCSLCSAAFDGKSKLEAHVRKHTGEKPFMCPQCPRQFSSKSLLKSHMSHRHLAERPFKCPECGKGFVSAPLLKNHVRHSHIEKFSSHFSSHAVRSDHSMIVQNQDLTSKTNCTSKTATESVSEMNCVSETDSEVVFNSRAETLSDNSATDLFSEVELESVNPSSLSSYHGHASSMTTLACEGQKVNDTHKAASRTYSALIIASQKATGQSGRKENHGKPACKVCGKVLSSFRSLKQHMDRHTGQKPHTCTVCARCFRVKQHLTWHMRTHSGEMPYKCQACNKAFAHSQSLKSHIQTSHRSAVVATKGRRKFSRSGNGEDIFSNLPDENGRASDRESQEPESNVSYKNTCESDNDSVAASDDCVSETFVFDDERVSEITVSQKSVSETKCASEVSALEGKVSENKRSSEFSVLERKVSKNKRVSENVLKKFVSETGMSETDFSQTLLFEENILSANTTSSVLFCTDENKRPTGSNSMFVCTVCGKTLKSRYTLKEHMYTHNGERPYICSTCGSGFNSKSYLRIHARLHTDEKPYVCSFCSKAFRTSDVLRGHIRTHTGEKPFMCGVCGDRFTQQHGLRAHIRRIHTKEKTHLCPVCGVGFYTSTEVTVHLRSHSHIKPHKCRKCGYATKTAYSLKLHMQTHGGPQIQERKICGVCGVSVRYSGMKEHLLIHTDVRPFKCKLCGNAFKSKKSLGKHMVTHTEDRRYRCEVCGIGYRRSHTLLRHYKNKHGGCIPLGQNGTLPP